MNWNFGKKAHKIGPYIVILNVYRKASLVSFHPAANTHFENIFPGNIHNDITLIDFQGDLNFYVDHDFNLALTISINKYIYFYL